jgi:hypothetical protein
MGTVNVMGWGEQMGRKGVYDIFDKHCLTGRYGLTVDQVPTKFHTVAYLKDKQDVEWFPK